MDGQVYLIARDPIWPSGADLTVRYDLSKTSIPAMTAEERENLKSDVWEDIADRKGSDNPLRRQAAAKTGQYIDLPESENGDSPRYLREYGGIRCTNVCPSTHCKSAAHWCLLPQDHEGLHVHLCQVQAMRAALEAGEAENERLKAAFIRESDEIGQILGKVLGYPWYKDDLANFPGATEADGVCVSEHVAASLAAEAAEAADVIAGLRDRADTAEQMLVDFITAEREQRERADKAEASLKDAMQLLSLWIGPVRAATPEEIEVLNIDWDDVKRLMEAE